METIGDSFDRALAADICLSISYAVEDIFVMPLFGFLCEAIVDEVEREKAREALAYVLAALPPSEIEELRAKLISCQKLSPMAESLFAWVMELHKDPPTEVTDELVQGISFLAKRVNQELEKMRRAR
jgi:hypothetical protein